MNWEALVRALSTGQQMKLFEQAEREGISPAACLQKIMEETDLPLSSPEVVTGIYVGLAMRRGVDDANEERADEQLTGQAIAKSILG